MRWVCDPSQGAAMSETAQRILARNKEAKANVVRLRKQLSDLLAQAAELGLVGEDEDQLHQVQDERSGGASLDTTMLALDLLHIFLRRKKRTPRRKTITWPKKTTKFPSMWKNNEQL